MAHEATHVRFARDLEKALGVRNKTEYYSGSVYPDSRYVTRLPRSSTHGITSLTPGMSDFDKGCFTHVLYDRIVGPRYLEDTEWHGTGITPLSEGWIQMTAAKLVEDHFSCEALGEELSLMLETDAPEVPPNQERPDDLERYYESLHRLYRKKPVLEDHLFFFQVFNIPMDVARRVIEEADKITHDPIRRKRIEQLYGQCLQESSIMLPKQIT